MLNHVVVVFKSGEVVSGVVTGMHTDNGGGVWLQADGLHLPAKRDFAEMLSLTVTG